MALTASPAIFGTGCDAPQCVAAHKDFKNGEAVCFIAHKISGITHMFHPECFMVSACRDDQYIENGVLSGCLCCDKGIEETQPYPSPEFAVPLALMHYVRSRDAQAVERLSRTRFVTPELRDWAASRLSK